MIDYHVTMNGISVTASYSRQAVEEIFISGGLDEVDIVSPVCYHEIAE